MINSMSIGFRLRYNKRDSAKHEAAANNHKSKEDRSNPFAAMIYVRVTINGCSKDLFSTNIKCPKGKWDFDNMQIVFNEQKIQQVVSHPSFRLLSQQASQKRVNLHSLLESSEFAWLLADEDYTHYLSNQKLKTIFNKFSSIEARYNAAEEILDFDTLGKEYRGEMVKNDTLLGVAKSYLQVIQSRIGSETASSTYDIYKRYVNKLEAYLIDSKRKNILISQVNYTFAQDFKVWMLMTKKHNANYVGRIIPFFKQVMDEAVRMGYIDHNPAKPLRVRVDRAPKIEWLEPEELEALWKLYESGTLEGREQKAAAAFLFCCHTGMAYIDYSIFNPERFEKERAILRRVKVKQPRIEVVDGMRVIVGNRVKSNTDYCIPLSELNPIASILLERAGSPENLAYVPNGHLNVFLKLLGAKAGIDKEIDFHMARKTFAFHLINIWKIPVESVIAIMGWKDIKEADPYVKLQNSRVVSDFQDVPVRRLTSSATRTQSIALARFKE